MPLSSLPLSPFSIVKEKAKQIKATEKEKLERGCLFGQLTRKRTGGGELIG